MRLGSLFSVVFAFSVAGAVGCGSGGDDGGGSQGSGGSGTGGSGTGASAGAGGADGGGAGGASGSSGAAGSSGAGGAAGSSGAGGAAGNSGAGGAAGSSGTGGAAGSSGSGGVGTGGADGGGVGGASGSGGSASGGASGSGGSGGSGTGGAGTGGSSTGGTGGTPACVESSTQECFSGNPSTKGIGACKAGTETCTNGAWGPCTGEVVATTEACNGADDDCDGQTDELGQLSCGQGACSVTIDACANGQPQTCTPKTPAPAETCDGVDDDCDGQTDEGCNCVNGTQQSCYSGPTGTSGVGACKSGTQTCVSGAWGACTGDVVPALETCNGADDDCDGQADEGLGNTVCGVGACQTVVPACANGQVSSCTPGTPGTETCNGKDDDCDGDTDEGLPTDTCGTGACKVTVPTCVNGAPNSCVPGTPGNELCNGIDDDCDGTPDDGLGTLSCGTGACSNTVPACSNGWPNQCFPKPSSPEICNGIDDDCDGQTDEGNPGAGAPCSTGLSGACGTGVSACTNGAPTCQQTTFPSSEVCDGVDNDCDGQTDEGNPGGGASCNTGLPGVCAPGTLACQNGALTCVQNQNPTAETCNGIDDDCNGQIDQGNPGGGASCNSGVPGACAAGVIWCTSGTLSCMQLVYPTAEVCANAKDDDCDGQTDESEDKDGDGFGHCGGDCCDAVGPCSGTPKLVNPGAYEVIGNGVDDDCDPNTSDTVPPTSCSPPPLQTPTTGTKLVQAMDICQFTTLNPPPAQKKWGVISAVLTSADGVTGPPQDIQVGVLANYGANVLPKKGTTMAAISSGTGRDQGDPGWVQPNGGWSAGTTGNPPPAYLAAHGGTLQTKPGCPAGSGANDSVNLKVQMRVPTNAKSFTYNFKFYSSEYPEWVCTQYNDFYLALLTSTVAGIPADKNISFDTFNNPVSVNNGFFDVCSGCVAGTAELVGTGMGGNNGVLTDGGGTKWLVTTSPIVPGEVMTIEFTIFDVGDHLYDSLVLLDNFQWSLDSATVGTKPAG